MRTRLEHGSKLRLAMRHSSRAGSDARRRNLAAALRLRVLTLRRPSILSRGGAVSTVKRTSAGALRFCEESIARTLKACAPSASGPTTWGEVQGAAAPESSTHRKLEPGALAENRNEGLGFEENAGGREEIRTVGVPVSTVHALIAAAPLFPA